MALDAEAPVNKDREVRTAAWSHFPDNDESGERRIDAVELEAFAKVYRRQLIYFLGGHR